MNPPELHHKDERQRLRALEALQVLDTPIEERFERITRLACRVFDVPICAISCIDEHRQWFKSIHGSCTTQTARCVSFCQHTILQDDAFVVEDARSDDRFRGTPLVEGDPKVVFYAGAPIYGSGQLPVAAFCVIDHKPRKISSEQIAMLKDFALITQHTLQSPAPNPVQDRMVHEVNSTWRRSLIDPLTRVWNAEGISALLDASVDPAKNTQGLLVAMIDPRGMEVINAEAGYVQGDKVLRGFVRGLPRVLGDKAIIGRIGSDKSLVIMECPGSADNSYAMLDDLRAYAENHDISDVPGHTTLGASIAALHVYPGWAGDADELVSQLHRELHQVKQEPRGSRLCARPAAEPDEDQLRASA